MSDSNSSVEEAVQQNPMKGPKAKRQTKDIRNKMVLNLSKLFRRLFDEKEMLISMVGLEGAGKTTILYKLGQNVTETSSSGLNMETVHYKNITFNVWDVRVRHDKTRPQWSNYFRDTKGLIFVVDITDRDSVVEARDELHRILNEESLKDAVVLVFANKQDLPNAMNSAEITENLGLSFSSSLRQRHCRVQITCATSGEGLHQGLDWLSNTIGFRKELEWIRINSAEKEYNDLGIGWTFQPTDENLISFLVELIDGKDITPDRVNRVNLFDKHPAVIIRNMSSELHSYMHDTCKHYLFYCKVPDDAKYSVQGYDHFEDQAEGVWERTSSCQIFHCKLSDKTTRCGERQKFCYKPVNQTTSSWEMVMYGLPNYPRSQHLPDIPCLQSNIVICKVFESADSENAKAVRSVLDRKRELQESLNTNSGHIAEIEFLETALREKRMQRYSARETQMKLMEMALCEQKMKRDSCCLDIGAKTRLLVKEMKKQKRIEHKEADAIEPPDRKSKRKKNC